MSSLARAILPSISIRITSFPDAGHTLNGSDRPLDSDIKGKQDVTHALPRG